MFFDMPPQGIDGLILKEQHQSLYSFLYEILPVLPILYLKHNAPALNRYRIADKLFIDLFSGLITP